MERITAIRILNGMLLEDMPQYTAYAASFPRDAVSQRRLLRALMNLRPPLPLRQDFLELQDAFLSAEREEKGVVDIWTLPSAAADPRLILWQGDITRLQADAVVNAANSALLGCFHPCHGCIDNAIHSAAGLQLREECHRIMEVQEHEEAVGQAKLTGGYNLPARYVLHTVGPLTNGKPTERQRKELASCYASCLQLAAERQLETVAFCCISTGEFRFPNREAAKTAVDTVTGFLQTASSLKRVIFNVYKDIDYGIYRELLG